MGNGRIVSVQSRCHTPCWFLPVQVVSLEGEFLTASQSKSSPEDYLFIHVLLICWYESIHWFFLFFCHFIVVEFTYTINI
uniref:Uncharacterized protein n=1 Tax=Salix viminalis TaxID=40686 RepID=A0A6N2KUR3_SALVM